MSRLAGRDAVGLDPKRDQLGVHVQVGIVEPVQRFVLAADGAGRAEYGRHDAKAVMPPRRPFPS